MQVENGPLCVVPLTVTQHIASDYIPDKDSKDEKQGNAFITKFKALRMSATPNNYNRSSLALHHKPNQNQDLYEEEEAKTRSPFKLYMEEQLKVIAKE